MPFKNKFFLLNHSRSSFECIDELVVKRVLPRLYPAHTAWRLVYGIKSIPLLPNGHPFYHPDEDVKLKFLSCEKFTWARTPQCPASNYFVSACFAERIALSDIGLWLDECIEHERKIVDRDKTYQLCSSPWSPCTFDYNKPVFFAAKDNRPRRYLQFKKVED